MAIGTFGTSNTYINYGINVTETSTNAANNTSVIRVWVDVYRTNTGYTTYGTGTVYVTVDGTEYTSTITSDQIIDNEGITAFEQTFTIQHNADGTKNVTVYAGIDHDVFYSGKNNSVTLALTRIARAANITACGCSTQYLNGPITTSFNSNSDNFTYKLRVSIPNVKALETISIAGTGTGTLRCTHTIPDAVLTTIYNMYTTTATVKIGIVIETYSGSTKVGESSESILTLKMPADVNPKFSTAGTAPPPLAAATVNGFNGLYLQNVSSCKLTVGTILYGYGAKVKSITISGSNVAYSGTGKIATTSKFATAGTFTYTATVTDTRGRTATTTVSVKVYSYRSPILKLTAYRASDTKGTRNDLTGTYIYVKPVYSSATVQGTGTTDLNAIAKKSLAITPVESSFTGLPKTDFFSNTGLSYAGASVQTSYTVTCSITDTVGKTAKAVITIKVGVKPFNIKANKSGVAIGVYATKDDTFEVGYLNTVINKINGKSLIDWIVPIGTQIYNSNENFDPGIYYPGTTWKRIKGCVLGGINDLDTVVVFDKNGNVTNDVNKKITFNRDAGTVIGSKYSKQHAHRFVDDSLTWAWNSSTVNVGVDMGSPLHVTGTKVQSGSSTITGELIANRNSTTAVRYNGTKLSNSGDAENIQPTMLTYIWERTA